MDVFLTGATGFVGSEILPRLVAAGHRIHCLVRPQSRERFGGAFGAAGDAVVSVPGDCLDRSSILNGMRGCQAVIHLVGIIREFPRRDVTFERLHVEATRNVVGAARQTGVERFVHMSALGTHPAAASPYHQSKFRAEQVLTDSGLKFVVFRPSIIYGPHDEFVNMLARMIRPPLPVPVIGDGRVRFQPVAVENVAEGFVRALTSPDCLNRTFAVGGPDAWSMNEILDAIARAKGRRPPRKIHIPISLLQRVVPLFEWCRFFPLTSQQLLMLQEDNVCDPGEFFDTFAIEPIEFETGIANYIGRQSG